ncbi:hypothetical protein CRX72_04510 [Pantoea sp. BRM17]|nr:hypothetical protein CRX72_04510 [Pantoea sp. BRM17]
MLGSSATRLVASPDYLAKHGIPDSVAALTRRLALTDEGAIFLEHARQILTSVERAEEQIARRRETPAGRLRINANTPFMLHVIVPLLAEFRQR